MDAEARKQQLRDDITIISRLLEEWKSMTDPELQWASHVLEYSLGQCHRELVRLQEQTGIPRRGLD